MLSGRDDTIFLFAFVIFGLGLLPMRALAQSPPSGALVIPKIQGKIELDGHIEEPGWEQAEKLPLVQHIPNFGESPTEETEVLIGYTEDYLYAACRCYDEGPLSAPSFKRDYTTADTDAFQIVLDTFNDNENALAFLTTPTGLRSDFAITNDASGRVPADFDWNTFWDVGARQSKEGWFAEMRIPISSLRFDADEGGTVRMGLSASRLVARKLEWMTFPAIPPNWGYFSLWKPSQFREALFEKLEPEPPLRITPYLLGGVSQRSALIDTETAYRFESTPTYDAGLDVKYGLTSDLTLDLTLNTDFAQVEADNQEINLTRFPLFFPEKRRFFKERASNFGFGFSGQNHLFYSRRIGLHEGEPVRILGGARLVGRAGPWDIGAIGMQTAREPSLGPDESALASENFAVVRLRRQAVNESSYVGGILTSRLGRTGNYNIAYGADGIFRVAGDRYVTARWAQTFETGAPNTPVSLDPARLHLRWEGRSYEGLGYDLRYDRAGGHYKPGVGLELRDNYFRVGDRVGYGWIPDEHSSIQHHRLDLESETYFRNEDSTLQSLTLGPAWEMATNQGHTLIVGASHRTEDLRAPFRLAEAVEVPADRYAFYEARASYGMPSGWDLRAGVAATGGQFYDGWRGTFEVEPTWNASRHLRLSGFYQLNRITFPGRNQAFTAHVSRLRLEITPSVEYSVSGFVQYNSVADVAVANLRFRYNPREGNDLYLVYNERLNASRSNPIGPRRPLTSSRTFLLKYTYTFNW